MSIAMLVMWMWMRAQHEPLTLNCAVMPDAMEVQCAEAAQPTTYACSDHPEYFPQLPLCHPSEPLDVPAVQEQVNVCVGSSKPPQHMEGWSLGCVAMNWTCSDKRRVLLTDESGKRHCILFGRHGE